MQQHACREEGFYSITSSAHTYLDEFAFRYNRRKTAGVGRIAGRVIEQLVARKPLTTHQLINEMRSYR